MKNNLILKTIAFAQGLLCVFALFALSSIQELPSSSAAIGLADHEYDQQDEDFAHGSGGLSLGTLLGGLRFEISTDGTYTSASNGTQIVFGGPDGAGEVDGVNAAGVMSAALMALKATGNGGKLVVSKGNYTITNKISVCNNVELLCTNGAMFTLGYNGTMFEFAGVTNTSLVGAQIFGNHDTYAGTAVVVKDFLGAGSCHNRVVNNSIHYCGIRGISVESSLSNYNNISFNVIFDVPQDGIMVSRSDYNTIHSNTIKRTGHHGIVSTGGSYNNITSNTIEDAGGNYVSGFAHGIAVDGNEGANVCFGNTIANNTIKKVHMAGIEVADGAHLTAIINNYVADTGAYGIYFGGSLAVSSDGLISGNTIVSCGSNGDQGILVSGVSARNRTWKVAVTGNMVDNAGSDGIRIKWINDSNITGNTCHGCAGFGLAFEDSNSDCIVIAQNNFKANSLGGLNLYGVKPLSTGHQTL